jgi:hypothetical protein
MTLPACARRAWGLVASGVAAGVVFTAAAAEGPLRATLFVSVTQSSDASPTSRAARAMDGFNATFSLTADVPGSYWTAALARAYRLSRIEVVNRATPNDQELDGLTLRLLNMDDQVVFETGLTNPGSAGTNVLRLPVGLLARSLWIGLLGNQTNGGGNYRVGLGEVRVFGELAMPFGPEPVEGTTSGVRLYQSSDYSASYPAVNAVDGNTATFTHTADQPDSFWMADLRAPQRLDRVQLVNRASCCSARLAGLVLRIFDGASNSVASSVLTDPGLGGTWTYTTPPGTVGRYIRVGLENGQRNGDGNYYVTLAEARVYSGTTNLLLAAATVSIPVTNNLASFKPSYMVRLTPSLPPATNANDDNISTSTETTTRTVDGYWEVDLGATYALYGVRTIAASGIGSRLTNTFLRLFDGAHESIFAQRLSGTPDVFDTDLNGPVFARYVRIGLEDKQRTDPSGGLEWYIGMREVEVFGRPTNEVGLRAFSASAARIAPGEPVTLSWSVEDVRRTEIRPALGSVGAHTAASGAGSLTLTPTQSTEYVLIASNTAGLFTRAVGVEVGSTALPVRLSEIVAENQHSLRDGNGEAPDWIELRNTGNAPVNLAGYGLSDDPARPRKWVFPATNLAPHSTLIVFASGRESPLDPAGFLHASFRLDNSGGSVVLTAPDGTTTVDALNTYPALDEDLAYGRDLEGNWTFLDPTPGAVNVARAYLGWLRPLSFSHPRGFYETPFSLTISNSNPGASVLYSLDGSAPSLPYTNAIRIAGTKAVRAQPVRAGYRPPRIQTHTYVFLNDVIASPLLRTSITTDPRYAPRLKPGLLALPSISLVVPGQPEYQEKEGSVEIFWPNGAAPVQANCGISRFGNAWQEFTKRSFRVKCRARYGTTKLQAPLFDGFDRGVVARTSFDEIDLRSGSQDMIDRGFYMAGRFVEDSMLDMGSLNPHGRFVHVYVNGVYWGQYDARELLVENFLADYLGGAAEDYVNVRGNDNVGDSFVPGTPEPPNIFPWDRVLARRNSYQAVRPYLDVRHLIDFMLLWFYGNCETEYRACGSIEAGSGFKFWIADADGFLRTSALGLNRTANTGPGDLFGGLVSEGNSDFKTLVADRIYAHFFNNGALTSARNDARLAARMQEIRDSLILECARWSYRTPSDWESAAATIRSSLFPTRTTELVSMLRTRGLFPTFNPPTFNLYGGLVTNGFQPQLSTTSGTIYYTLDGSDPRLPGGAISPQARVWSAGVVSISQDLTLSARVRATNGQWSALAQPRFLLATRRAPTARDLLVTEIHYNPAGSDEYEFLELHNASSNLLDLSGLTLSNAARFIFPNGYALAPGAFIVVVENTNAFAERYQDPASPWYWSGLNVVGEWVGALDNAGERLVLLKSNGVELVAVPYRPSGDWPERADGRGSSLELRRLPTGAATDMDAQTLLADGRNWTSSSLYHGSPGRLDDFVRTVRINEVLSHTDVGEDWIELLNRGDQPVDLSGCTLTDNLDLPDRWVFPTNSVLPPGHFMVLTALQLGFSLGRLGDDVSLLRMTGTNVSRFLDTADFPAATWGETFGLFERSDGELDFTELRGRTRGGTNALPRVGPVVFSEIMAAPAPGLAEFIELTSVTNGPVPLFDPARPTNVWQIEGVGNFAFPTGTVLQACGSLIVCSTNAAAFRAQYGLSASVLVFGPWSGALDDDGETLKLLRPGDPQPDGTVPDYRVDHVTFRAAPPWPPTGVGRSLEKLPVEAYGNDPAYWRAGPTNGTPGLACSNRPPVIAVSGDPTVNEQAAMTLTLSATDLDAPWQSLSLAASRLPDGGSFDASSGVFAWTPSEPQGPGSYAAEFVATDSAACGSGRTTLTLPLTVNESNQPPVWAAQADIQCAVGVRCEIPLSVSDADLPRQPLSFEVTGLPAGFQFDTNTLRIVGAGALPGEHLVAVTAFDGQEPPLPAMLQFAIRVTDSLMLRVTFEPDAVQISFPAVVGGSYRVEHCGDPALSNWQVLQEIPRALAHRVTVLDTRVGTRAQTFYRLRRIE